MLGLLAPVLAGCALVSPPKTPIDAPFELVADNAKRELCGLNRTELAVGSHVVDVVADTSGVKVTLLDPSGVEQVIYGGKRPVDQVQLTRGTYRVTCDYPGGKHGSATLAVVAVE